DQKLAIAFSNFSIDPAYDVLIETDVKGKEIELIGAEGEMTEKGFKALCIQPWATGCVIIHK
ncbi:MAG: hypothetical protein IIX93_02070, partial [Clostridia bacterium]|nr:hypothetical protein [Clostridia bacterium]